MQEMTVETRWPTDEDRRYFHSGTVVDGVSEPVRVPAVGREVAIAVVPGTSALVEYTLSSYEKVEAGEAMWMPWGLGSVTEASVDASGAYVSAVRLSSQGESTWEVAV